MRDVVVEILSGIIRVDLESISFRSSKILDTLISLEMELNPVSFTLVINPLESVGRITVHSSETIRGTSVREQDSHLMSRFWSLGEEIPEHVRALEIALRVSLLGVDEIREFNRVSNEEHGGVVTNHIPIAFFSVKLDSETTRISFGISRSLFSSDSGESKENRSALANGIEELSLAELSDIIGGFKITPSTSSLSMDDSFGNSFSIEMS